MASVPAGTTSGPGNAGAAKGFAVTVAHSALVRTSPRHPWSPPPSSDSTLAALARSSNFSLFRAAFVGVPWIGVGVLYLKCNAA